MTRGRKPTPAIDRVLARCVAGAGGCLLWTGNLTSDGYGTIRIGSRIDGSRRMTPVHRVTWEHMNGPVPDGLEIDHTCKTRSCVNVQHLRAVTHLENMQTATFGWKRHLTHCGRGHEFTPENTHIRSNGTRSCRSCWPIRRAAQRKARAAA